MEGGGKAGGERQGGGGGKMEGRYYSVAHIVFCRCFIGSTCSRPAFVLPSDLFHFVASIRL